MKGARARTASVILQELPSGCSVALSAFTRAVVEVELTGAVS